MKLLFIVLPSLFLVTVRGAYLCGMNQYWNRCASGCYSEPTCENLPGGLVVPGEICQGLCVEKCSCEDGYVWHNGQCITPLQCPVNECADTVLYSCGIGGYFDPCTSGCNPPPTCADPFPAPLPPDSLCVADCVPGCSCYPGYYLQNGVCVDWSFC
ncbi:SCO-spondin [Dendroctonus ponderosae]|uniref:SCO-spondin n=1 Tax=Dendroctonus ponderosae TaxID=77166 RepID=UPI0020355CD6|nr:SCO-spondin [Dendroctonus ponderosae]KAH1015019.1 hypothetical protein HUJ05_012802 [Dendroctonus ponderosae]